MIKYFPRLFVIHEFLLLAVYHYYYYYYYYYIIIINIIFISVGCVVVPCSSESESGEDH